MAEIINLSENNYHRFHPTHIAEDRNGQKMIHMADMRV